MKTLEEQINADFLEAFKKRELDKKNFLGLLKSEIANAKKLKSYREDTPLTILKKMKKSLEEGASRGHEKSKSELIILNKYLPELMSEVEIKKCLIDIIAEGSDNIGLVMRNFNIQNKGKADNLIVKNIAEVLLNDNK